MDRTEILASMGELKLYGMKAAYDEIVATAVKREHEPARIIGDLLSAEISEKQARSIKYQITIAKMPCAKAEPCLANGPREIGEGTSSPSRTRRSTTPWCVISPAATSSSISATWC